MSSGKNSPQQNFSKTVPKIRSPSPPKEIKKSPPKPNSPINSISPPEIQNDYNNTVILALNKKIAVLFFYFLLINRLWIRSKMN